MASIINASNSGFGGVVTTGDSSGILTLQTAGTTAVTLDTSQNATFAGKVTSAGALTLASNGTTTALTINTSQNVGIGTTSPDGKLHVMTSSAGSVTSDADADDLTIEGATNPGISILGTGDDVCSVYFGNPGTNGQKDGGIRYFQESFATVADRRSMTFITSNTERMRIDSSGNVLVGCTATPSASVKGSGFISDTAGTDLYLALNTTGSDRVVWFYNPNGLIGGIVLSGSATTYSTSSDYRLKENIIPMTGALDTVQALKPVTYKWKVDGSDGQGFIAHELAEVVPQAVTGEKDAINEDGSIDPQGIDTSFLVATLTAAIQEQQTIINDLKARIETLEAK